jgi:hypothetical protein
MQSQHLEEIFKPSLVLQLKSKGYTHMSIASTHMLVYRIGFPGAFEACFFIQ